jgi:hypothetical protein
MSATVRTYYAQAHQSPAQSRRWSLCTGRITVAACSIARSGKVRQALHSIANDGKRAGDIVVRTELMKKVAAADRADPVLITANRRHHSGPV